MPLTDRTNLAAPPRASQENKKSVTVPSRFAMERPGSGMPSVRSQLESATAARDDALRRCTAAVDARQAAEARERAVKASHRCVSQTLGVELGHAEVECAQVAETNQQQGAQLETAAAALAAERGERTRCEEVLRDTERNNTRLEARVAQLEAELCQCHAGCVASPSRPSLPPTDPPRGPRLPAYPSGPAAAGGAAR